MGVARVWVRGVHGVPVLAKGGQSCVQQHRPSSTPPRAHQPSSSCSFCFSSSASRARSGRIRTRTHSDTCFVDRSSIFCSSHCREKLIPVTGVPPQVAAWVHSLRSCPQLPALPVVAQPLNRRHHHCLFPANSDEQNLELQKARIFVLLGVQGSCSHSKAGLRQSLQRTKEDVAEEVPDWAEVPTAAEARQGQEPGRCAGSGPRPARGPELPMALLGLAAGALQTADTLILRTSIGQSATVSSAEHWPRGPRAVGRNWSTPAQAHLDLRARWPASLLSLARHPGRPGRSPCQSIPPADEPGQVLYSMGGHLCSESSPESSQMAYQ